MRLIRLFWGGKRRFWKREGKLEIKVSCRFWKFFSLRTKDQRKSGDEYIANALLSGVSSHSLDKVQQGKDTQLSVLGFLFSDFGLSVVGLSELIDRKPADR